ncbi:hypothetical protein HOY82DRAFT_73211 [Tuber indicum]|nr:hypothetical protein HOY82DRAFT_73211 [Tuber indicum]
MNKLKAGGKKKTFLLPYSIPLADNSFQRPTAQLKPHQTEPQWIQSTTIILHHPPRLGYCEWSTRYEYPTIVATYHIIPQQNSHPSSHNYDGFSERNAVPVGCRSGTRFCNNTVRILYVGYVPSLLVHAKPNQTKHPTGGKSNKKESTTGVRTGYRYDSIKFGKVLTNKTKTKANKQEIKPTGPHHHHRHDRLGYLGPYRRFFWAFLWIGW